MADAMGFGGTGGGGGGGSRGSKVAPVLVGQAKG